MAVQPNLLAGQIAIQQRQLAGQLVVQAKKPAGQIAAIPASLKRSNAIEMPMQSKRARLPEFAIPGKNIPDQNPLSTSFRTLKDTATRTSLLAPYVSSINVERRSLADAGIGGHDKPVAPRHRLQIVDLLGKTPEPEDPSLTRSTNLEPEQKVDPWLQLKSSSREITPVESAAEQSTR